MSRGYKNANTNLTQNRLREVLDYDIESGDFTWKITRGKARQGQKAGWVQRAVVNRIKIAIDGIDFMAHRLAWLYVTGEWPPYEVDHENLDGTDNRWSNLRLAESSENQCNRRLQRNNTSGYKGVHFDKRCKRFVAYIKRNRRRYHLGYFDNAEDAATAYAEAAKRLHGNFANLDHYQRP